MTTIEILNNKLKAILGNSYEAKITDGVKFYCSGYRVGHNLILDLVQEKSNNEVKKELMKYCLMINLLNK